MAVISSKADGTVVEPKKPTKSGSGAQSTAKKG